MVCVLTFTPSRGFFFFLNLWGRWSGDHPQGLNQIWLEVGEESRKTVEILVYFATCWNLLSKYDNFRFFFPSKSGDFGPFLPKKSIVEVALAFFLGCWVVKNRQKTKHRDSIVRGWPPVVLMCLWISWSMKAVDLSMMGTSQHSVRSCLSRDANTTSSKFAALQLSGFKILSSSFFWST